MLTYNTLAIRTLSDNQGGLYVKRFVYAELMHLIYRNLASQSENRLEKITANTITLIHQTLSFF